MGITFMPKTATIVSTLGPNMINAANVAATGNANMPRRLIFPYPLIVAPDSYIFISVASNHKIITKSPIRRQVASCLPSGKFVVFCHFVPAFTKRRRQYPAPGAVLRCVGYWNRKSAVIPHMRGSPGVTRERPPVFMSPAP